MKKEEIINKLNKIGIIKRTHNKYIEIEKLEYHESFIAIVYEMYIRSLGIDILNNKKNTNQSTKNIMSEVNNTMEEAIKIYKDKHFNDKEYFYSNTKRIDQIILYEINNQKFTLSDVIYNIFPHLYNGYSNDNMSIYEFKNILNNESNNFIEAIFKDKYQNKYIKITKEFIQEKIDNQLYNVEKTFYMKYSRPTLYHKKHKIVNINNLNLSMSNKAINYYLDKLREQILESNEKIFSFYENEYLSVESDNNIDTKLGIKMKTIMKNPQKMADILYIYDVLEFECFAYKNELLNENLKDKKSALKIYIQQEIYNNRKGTILNIESSTINNYYSLSKKLINNKQYLNLYQ